ncbi:MAG: MFS transporter [Acidimicrobiia bacterium]|nr:MFS transporter [Acidimicrobiia bacterium]MCY4458248.1 MFS transporter [Acidimicrobiaceae bacterium]
MDEEQGIEGGPIVSVNPMVAARALLLGIALLMAGNGLQGSLVGVRANGEGFSIIETGFVMTCYFAGFFVGGLNAQRLISQVGHIRVFAALASVASAAALLYVIVISPVSWGLMRFVTGMCISGLFIVAESWLNDMATNATRGRLLSMYMVATMGGMTAGQFLLQAADTNGFQLFVLASLLVSVSLVPVTLSASSNPPLGVPEPLSTIELARSVPTGVISTFWVGTSAGVLMGLGAVYAVAVELPEARIPIFLAAPLVGSVVMQWPIGWLSDRAGRRSVMLWVATAASLTCAFLALIDPQSWLVIVLMFALGGTTFSLYSLTIAYTADWLPQSQLTAASASLVRVNGVGAVVGPLLFSPIMAWTSPQTFYWALVMTHGLIAGYLIWRVLFRNPVPRELQRRFVIFPARASAVASNLIGRRRRIHNP